MARDHARVKVNIWADPDWRQLPAPAQWLYLHVLSSPKLNYAGVGDWRPKRIAAHADGSTADGIEWSAYFLEQGESPLLVIDRDTEEVLVRSFIRHDGLLWMPNVTIAAVKAWQGTASEVLRGVIAWEMARAHKETPDAPAFNTAGAAWKWVEPVLMSDVIDPAEALTMVDPNPSVDPSDEGSPTNLRRVR